MQTLLLLPIAATTVFPWMNLVWVILGITLFIFAVAGLGQWGTLGAVDFITDPARLEKLRESAPNRRRDANLQVIIGVDVVNGAIGPPKVLATYFW